MEGQITSYNLKDNQVAILTTFYQVDPAYSLCNVVEDQIKMFVMHGYKIKLLVDKGLDESTLRGIWKHPNVTLCKFRDVSRSNEGILPMDWQDQANSLYEELKEILKDSKIVIAHDIILQPAHIIHNIAARRLAHERIDLKWLHWCHSATAPQVRCSDPVASEAIKEKFPHSVACYPNAWDRKRVAQSYGYEMDEVKIVPHPSDFAELMFGKEIDFSEYPSLSEENKNKLDKEVNYPIQLSKEFIKEFDILNSDVITTQVARLDRGKQIEFGIKTMGTMKKLGRKVSCIVIDFHSNGGDKVTYREELERIGIEWGLTPKEFVMNMNKISDWKIHASTSETFSLVAMEAMIWRNFCVLNHHTPYMREIYGSENVIHEEFGSAVNALTGEAGATNISIYNEEEHFENLAKKVLYWIEKGNPSISQWRYIRQNFGLRDVFRKKLEQLLFGIK